MSKLTKAIVSHDYEEMSKIISKEPELAQAPHEGKLPIEWAESTGNLLTLLRFLRLTEVPYLSSKFEELLIKICSRYWMNYFGGGSPESFAIQIWEQVIENKFRAFSKEESKVNLDTESKLDYSYLLKQANILSKKQLLEIVLPT